MKRTQTIILSILLTALVIALSGCASTPAPAPTLAPSGGPGKIAFEQQNNGDNTDIFLVSSDGSGKRLLVDGSKTWNGTPALSPDGTRLAYASERSGNAEIYVMNLDGAGLTQLTQDPAPDIMPSWSPDGKRIAFISNRLYKTPLKGNMDVVQTGMELYIMNADGSNPTRLTSNQEDSSAYPDWSPDGKKIVYMSVADLPSIATIDVDQANALPRSAFQRSNMAAWTPKWSPDGKYIYFMADDQKTKDLYRMDADGKNVTNLTDKWAEDAADPAPSPDGTQLVFASDKNDAIILYLMDLKTKEVRALMDAPGAMMSRPTWVR